MRSIKFTLILSITGLVTTSTDEFVILILRNGDNHSYILKIISIYGLYASVIASIFTILNNYIYSKKVLIGLTIKNTMERSDYMHKLQIKTFVLSLLGATIGYIIVPF